MEVQRRSNKVYNTTYGAVDDAQSSLTPGQAYYVQNDGTLSTSADSPSVFAGTVFSPS